MNDKLEMGYSMVTRAFDGGSQLRYTEWINITLLDDATQLYRRHWDQLVGVELCHLRNIIIRAGLLNWLRFAYDFEIGPAEYHVVGQVQPLGERLQLRGAGEPQPGRHRHRAAAGRPLIAACAAERGLARGLGTPALGPPAAAPPAVAAHRTEQLAWRPHINTYRAQLVPTRHLHTRRPGDAMHAAFMYACIQLGFCHFADIGLHVITIVVITVITIITIIITSWRRRAALSSLSPSRTRTGSGRGGGTAPRAAAACPGVSILNIS
jgi:hypothetical protein